MSKPKRFIIPVDSPKYKLQGKMSLSLEKGPTWNEMFTEKFPEKKKGLAPPGFFYRSRNKCRVLFCSNDCLILTEGAMGTKKIHIIKTNDEDNRTIIYEGKLPGKYSAFKANQRWATIYYKNAIGLLNLESGQVTLIEFELQPFRCVFGKNFWLVGLREGFQQGSSGELYCFSYNCDFLWGCTSAEEVGLPMFGNFKVVPYYLEVPKEQNDIFFRSWHITYHLDNKGKFLNRVSLLEKKEMPAEPGYLLGKALLPNLFIDSTTTIDWVFDHDNKKLFFLELDGTVTAWDYSGSFLWGINISEREVFCRCIALFNEMILVIDESGNGTWLDYKGNIISTQKFPGKVISVVQIPSQKSTYFALQINSKNCYMVNENTYVKIPNMEGGQFYLFRDNLIYHCYYSYFWRPFTQLWQPFSN